MIEVRPFANLGHSDHGWLKAAHHFSIGGYHDPDRMGWGALRVWNDDEFASGSGFPLHPHSDMEIITYVRTGAITHEDSLGNRGRTEAGDVQVMSAGSGIRHSEFNLENETTSLFQIWIKPSFYGATPRWGTRPFPKPDRSGRLVTLASGRAADQEALPLRADARLMAATLVSGQELQLSVQAERYIYLVALGGAIAIDGVVAGPRDGVAITGESDLRVSADAAVELVVVDTA